ncbi:lipase family protein [Wolbachia endosymbiont (group E) of Neria commutata]|uniref:lipase family protein n=1 Tax=Wolbachia endosymbiont (group E) of Neria commutata TaxID=3066149 RepID=UPI003132C667
MDFNFLRNWFSTITADTNSKFGVVEESTLPLSSVNFTYDLKIEEGNDQERDDFEFINLPDENEIHSLPYCETDESVAEIAGFNREKLSEMCAFSKITYGSNDTQLSEAKYKTKAELINEGYSIIPFFYSDGRHAGFVFTKGEEVTIAYRGTKDIYDLMADVNVTFATSSELLSEGGRMHSGFYNAFKDSWSSLYKILATHASEQTVEIQDFKFNLTGHSMGGAIAKIAALCLNKAENAQDVHVATFGDPRVVNEGVP